jgi:hypothetical protein
LSAGGAWGEAVNHILLRIKRAVLAGRYAFSEKARLEMMVDGLTELDVAESILNARSIYKRIRSRSTERSVPREYLYVIHGRNFSGLAVYTKGRLEKDADQDLFYFLISSKRSVQG